MKVNWIIKELPEWSSDGEEIKGYILVECPVCGHKLYCRKNSFSDDYVGYCWGPRAYHCYIDQVEILTKRMQAYFPNEYHDPIKMEPI